MLAYLSKEQAIVLPAFMVIEAWVVGGRPPIDLSFARRAARAAAPQLFIALLYLATRRVLLPMDADNATSLPLADHALSVLETFGYFFTFSLAPHEHSVQQGLIYSVHGELHHSIAHVVLGGVGLGALLAVALICLRRLPGVTLGVGFYLATLLPTSNVVYTGMKMLVSERFLYVPLLGLAFAIGSLAVSLRPPARRLATWILLAAALATVAASMRRSADYGDEQRFWAHELALHPTSSEAHSYFAGRAVQDKRYERALAEIVELQRAFDDRDMPVHERLRNTVKVVTILGLLVPDLDTASLQSLDRFLAAMLAADQSQIVLDLHGVRQAISPTGVSYKKELPRFLPQLLALRAELAVRLGNDAGARALVVQARTACATCTIVVTAEAKMLSRAGSFDEALVALDRIADHTTDEGYALMRARVLEARQHRDASLSATGPAAIREQALMYSTLESWGAAYRVLAPHKDDFAHVSEVALGFAELAFRAGAPDVAKQILALHVPAAEIQPMLDDWAAKMGWRD